MSECESYCLIIPLVYKIRLVCQKVNIPIKCLKMTNEVVMNVTGSAFLEEWSPVLVIIADLSVQEEVNKLWESRVFEGGASDLLLPVVHHHPPAVLVVVVLVERPPLHGRVLQLVPEGAENSLEGMADKENCFSFLCELWINVPWWQISKLPPGQGVGLTIQALNWLLRLILPTWSQHQKLFEHKCRGGLPYGTKCHFVLFGAVEVLPHWSVWQILFGYEWLELLCFWVQEAEIWILTFVSQIVFFASVTQCLQPSTLFLLQLWYWWRGRGGCWCCGGGWCSGLLILWPRPRRVSWNIVVDVFDNFLNLVSTITRCLIRFAESILGTSVSGQNSLIIEKCVTMRMMSKTDLPGLQRV